MNKFIISDIQAREVLDAHGQPTVEVGVWLEGGAFYGRAIVPSSGQSSKKAWELRDQEARFGGLGVLKAAWNVNSAIKDVLVGNRAEQKVIDQLMLDLDGTEDKSVLGANAILAVSMAMAKAVARADSIPFYKHVARLAGINDLTTLPLPVIDVINDNGQTYLLPIGAKNIRQAIQMGVEVDKNVVIMDKSNLQAVEISLSQFGTLTEIIDAVATARRAQKKIMMSCSTNETEDTMLAHLAVGLEADYMRAGVMCGSEHIAKYNELMLIADSNSRLGLIK